MYNHPPEDVGTRLEVEVEGHDVTVRGITTRVSDKVLRILFGVEYATHDENIVDERSRPAWLKW